MKYLEFRAYDFKGKTLIYDRDLWLPKELKKLGHKEHPVTISQEGIHYTLDCLSNHYENDWEEDVVAIHNIQIMQCTHLFDFGESKKKMYCNDIISFYPSRQLDDLDAQKMIGRIQFSAQTGKWVIVDHEEQFLSELSLAEQPKVIGNWYDNPELLG